MSRRKKNRSRSFKESEIPRVTFNEDEDAKRLFLESLERMGPEAERKRQLSDSEGLRSHDEPSRGPKGRSAQDARQGVRSLDLHGKTLDEAIEAVDRFLGGILATLKGQITVRIITGKGLHSGRGGGVLPREVHAHVRGKYHHSIARLDESPAEVRLSGLPIRGHFDLTLRR